MCSRSRASLGGCLVVEESARGGEHGSQRRGDDVGVGADSPACGGVAGDRFYVGHGGCVGAATERVLVVVDDVELDTEPVTNGGDERRDWAVAFALHRARFAVDDHLRGDRGVFVVAGDELVRVQSEARLVRQVHRP